MIEDDEINVTIESRELSPHQRLWLAVISRAVQDADGSVGPYEVLPARDWLLLPEHLEWRQAVCEMAGISEETLRARVRRMRAPQELFPGHDFNRRPSDARRERPRASPASVIAHMPRQGRRHVTFKGQNYHLPGEPDAPPKKEDPAACVRR